MKELTEKQLKKREYNRTQREKKKLLQAQKEHIQVIEDGEDEVKEMVEEIEETKDNVILDKETYDYLLSKAKSNAQVKEVVVKEQLKEVVKEEPKQEVVNFQSPQPSILQMLKNQTISMAVGIIPIIALQGLVLGAKYITTLKKRTDSQQNTFMIPTCTNQFGTEEHYFTR